MTAGLLTESDRRDAELRARLAAWQEGYQRGRADGYQDGYRDGRADSDEEWMYALEPARAAARRAATTPTFAELERRRWGPGGREHFADPRPGDHMGGPARPW